MAIPIEHWESQRVDKPPAVSPWPFLAKRVLGSNPISQALSPGWRFCQSFAGPAAVTVECAGTVDLSHIYEHMTHIFRADEKKLAKVVVHGEGLPGRVVRVLAVSIFSQDHSDLADQFVAEPLRGLLEFLKGESFAESEFILWETITTTAATTRTGSHPALSSRLAVTSPPSPSSAPGAGSSPAST